MSNVQEQLKNYRGWAALPLRAALGASFIAHGAPKVFGKEEPRRFGAGVAGVEKILRANGTPYPQLMAWVLAFTEWGGGILLLLGLFTRLIALMQAFTMIVAIAKVTLKKGFIGGYELNVSLLSACLALAITGGGPLSVDELVGLP